MTTNSQPEGKCEAVDMVYMSNPPQFKCRHCGNFWYFEDSIPMCKSKYRLTPSEGWEERFNEQFGKRGPEGDSDSVGRKAGCDDCKSNIKIREEYKEFARKEITAAEERGYQRGLNDSAGLQKFRLIPGERGVDNTA